MNFPAKVYRKLRLRFGSRKFHAFGVGPGKSGTHSLADIFQPNYRAAHEPESRIALNALIEHRHSQLSDDGVRQYLRDKDRRLRLEVDSAGCNAFFARFLVEEFPDAKFIMTVRDCFSWANSAINQTLNNPTPQSHWLAWRNELFGDAESESFEPEESALREHKVWPLHRIFAIWALHYESALAVIPEERLLILRIHDLAQEFDRIAAFLGIPVRSLNRQRTVAYQAPRDLQLLQSITPQFVSATAKRVCGPLMQRFYPETPCEVEGFLKKRSR